jgi:hypothetical protein
MSSSSIVAHSLDDFFASTPIGSIDSALTNNIYGINATQVPSALLNNKDHYGFTFFVKPQLNLQGDNIRNSRKFYPLLTQNLNSIPAVIRGNLDPRIVSGYAGRSIRGRKYQGVPLNIALVDKHNPFIPFLTNNLTKLSGWPEFNTSPFTSKPGRVKESFSLFDDTHTHFEPYQVEASFRNTRGDPIAYMMYLWYIYQGMVFDGTLVPYMDFVTENCLDYVTRIYRFTLDPFKETITKYSACGYAFPISAPTGSFFDFSNELPYSDQHKEFSVRFQCVGFDVFDDIVLKEFNDCVGSFNPYMVSDKNRLSYMTKIDKSLLPLFNHRCYPRINLETKEFEWWTFNQTYLNKRTNLLSADVLDQTQTNDFSGD